MKQAEERVIMGRRRASLNEDLPITPNTEEPQPKIAKIKYQPPGTSRNKSKPPGL